MPCGGTEIPHPRFSVSGDEAIPDELVTRPLTNDGARNVADVVLVEAQHRTEAGFCQRLARARHAIAMQPLEIDALFEVDLRGARRLQRAIPAMRRVEIALVDRNEFRFVRILR